MNIAIGNDRQGLPLKKIGVYHEIESISDKADLSCRITTQRTFLWICIATSRLSNFTFVGILKALRSVTNGRR